MHLAGIVKDTIKMGSWKYKLELIFLIQWGYFQNHWNWSLTGTKMSYKTKKLFVTYSLCVKDISVLTSVVSVLSYILYKIISLCGVKIVNGK